MNHGRKSAASAFFNSLLVQPVLEIASNHSTWLSSPSMCDQRDRSRIHLSTTRYTSAISRH
jgi:hypothetical protein